MHVDLGHGELQVKALEDSCHSVSEVVQKSTDMELLHQPVLSAIRYLIDRIEVIENRYATDIAAAARELRNDLRCHTSTASHVDEAELERSIAFVISRFEDRVLDALDRWESARQWFADRVEKLRDRADSNDVLAEIERVEAQIVQNEQDIKRCVHSPSNDLGSLMRMQASQSESKAYVRGLKFQVKDWVLVQVGTEDALPLRELEAGSVNER
jgi:hypothetical protein